MAFARDVYTASASQTDFVITFSYIDSADVLVYEDGTLKTVTTDYTLPDATTIRFGSGLTSGTVVVIQRSTSQSTRLVTYTAGPLLTDDLNNDSLQAFYMAQEAIDIANNSMGLGADDNWDAGTLQIKNIVDGTADQDAITKAQLDAAVLANGNVPTPSGQTGYLLVATASSFAWNNTVSAAIDFTGGVSLTETTDDATEGPTLTLHRDRATVTDSDAIGTILFAGEDDGSNQTTYAKIRGEILDQTDTTEDGSFEIWTMQAGTLTRAGYFNTGMVMEGATGGDQGAGTINATALYVNGVAVSPAAEIWVPAGAMLPRTTAGAAAGLVELATNDIMLQTLDFDAATDEFAQFSIVMPSDWDLGTVTATFYWSAASGSGDVIWGLQGLAVGNDDAQDAAMGTAQTVTDTLLLADDLQITAATSAMTIAGTPAAGDIVHFAAYRDANAGGDTLAVDARLQGVKINYTRT
jgi:hypothetical protein